MSEIIVVITPALTAVTFVFFIGPLFWGLATVFIEDWRRKG